MPDKGGFLHNMQHSTTTSYDPSGILYDNSYTKLRNDPDSEFQFPPEFFMQLYVNPSTPSATKQQLIFSKWSPGSLVHLELWIETTLPTGNLIVVDRTDTFTLTSFFQYDQYTCVRVSFNSGRLKIYKDAFLLANVAGTCDDGANTVCLFFTFNGNIHQK